MMRQPHNQKRSRHRGVTLVETVLSLLILAGAFASALTAIGSSRASQMAAADRRLGLLLAEDIMAEVLAAPAYKEGSTYGPEADEVGQDRENFDDVDDYNNWLSSPPVDNQGAPIPGAEDYSRRVQVLYVNPNVPKRRESNDMGLVLVVVRVRHHGRLVAELWGYRSDVWHVAEEGY